MKRAVSGEFFLLNGLQKGFWSLFQEDAEEDEEEDGAAWASGEGPDGMGCTAVVALVMAGPVSKVHHPRISRAF